MSAMEIDDQPLVDPFLIINEELHDLICQHFTGKEVITLSTVSKQWKYNIGVSPAAMKKIKLVYDTQSSGFSSKDVTAVLTSERCYYNVKLYWLSIPKRTRSCYEQFQVVEKIAPWVKNLEVYNSTIGDIGLKFPKIEKFELIRSSINPISNGITPNKLKALVILLTAEEMQSYNEFLTKCSKLQELCIYNSSSVSFFETEAAFPFKLKTFKFCSNNYPMKPSVIVNFEKFLLSQSSSLQCLKLIYCNIEYMVAALKTLSLLKELDLFNLPALEELRLTVNHSVEILTLHDFDNLNLLELLVALPNLKILKLYWNKRYNSDIDMIASIAMNLREVTFEGSFEDVEEYYATFRQNNPNANQQIQWTVDRNYD